VDWECKVGIAMLFLAKLRLSHLGTPFTVINLTCTVVVLTCFVICGCVCMGFVMCGCLGDMYTCIYSLFYCLYCVFCIISFRYIYSYFSLYEYVLV
jgi:hypothetical protein